MTTKKQGQEPAFPFKGINTGSGFEDSIGMSKRFYAACAAMQGILSSTLPYFLNDKEATTPEDIVEISFKFADELLKQENK